MTESEREMLLGEPGQTEKSRPRKRSRFKRVLLGALALVIVLSLTVWLAGPSIAAALAPRDIPVEIAGRPGQLLLNDLDLSWRGPQRVGGARVIDADGNQMADLVLQSDTGLIGALWSGDLGTIQVSGALDLREQHFQPGPAAIVPPKPAPGAAQPAAQQPTGKPLRLPDDVRFTLQTTSLDVSYTPINAALIRVQGLDLSLTYDRGHTLMLAAKSASPVAHLTIQGSDITDSDGYLTPHSAQLDLTASATLPGALVDSLVRALLARAAPSTQTAAGPTPDTRIAAAAKVRAGRLTLTGPASPIIIQTPLPGPIASLMDQGEFPVTITQPPVFTFTVRSLDLPLVVGATGLDFRGAALALSIKSTEARARLALAEGQTPSPVVISPWETVLTIADFNTGLNVAGEARVLVDDAEAGAIRLSADATGLLDSNGRLTPTPQSMRAELRLEGAPVGLFEPLVAGRDFSLTQTLGPSLSGIFSAQTKTHLVAPIGQTPKPAPPGAIELTAQLRSSHMDLWTVLVTDGARIWSEGRAARIELDNPGPALRAMLAERGIEATGEGLIIAEVHDLDLPLLNWSPDLSRTHASVRLAVGDLTTYPIAISRPIELTSLQTNITYSPGPRFDAAIDYQIKSGPIATRATGNLDLVNLASRALGGPPWIEFTPHLVRPIGVIEIVDIPADALGLLPEPWGAAASDSLGAVLSGRIDLAASEGSQDIDITLSMTGQGARVNGRFVLDEQSLRTVGEGFTLNIDTPEPLARAALAQRPGAQLQWQSPLRATIKNLTLPRNTDSLNLSNIAAAAHFEIGELSLRLTPDAPWIQSSSLIVDAAIAKGGTATLELDGKGLYDSHEILAKGNLTLSDLFAHSESFDPEALRADGTLVLTGIPGSLAMLAPGEVGVLAREALGERFDLKITLPAPAPTLPAIAGKTGPGARFALTGPALSATTDARLFQRDLWIGPTDAQFTVSPALLASADRVFDLNGALPTLNRAARLSVQAQPVVFTFDQNWTPDMRSLRPIQAMVNAEDDVILDNVPIGPDGAPRSIGLRALVLGASYHRNDMIQSEGSIRANLFNPVEPNAQIAELNVVSGLIFPRPPALNATFAKIDTERLDRLLDRPGLTSEALGNQAGLSLNRATGGAGRPFNYQFTLVSPRLEATGSFVELADRYQLAAPIAINWEAPASWLNQHLLTPTSDNTAPPALTFTDSVSLAAEIRALTIGADAMFSPEIFNIDARLSTPAARMVTNQGERISMEGVALSITSGQDPSQLLFSMTADRQSVQRQGGAADVATSSDPLRATGTISNFADANGDLSTQTITIDGSVTGSAPTALIDTLTRSDDLLVDLLGATTSVNISARSLSRAGGELTATAATSNADANLKGHIEDGQFIAAAEPSVTLRRITPALSSRAFETIIPIITRIEKTEQDKPATLHATNLTFPVNGDVSLLNGTVRVDLGTVQFDTSDLIGKLLKATGNRAQGSLGRSVKPFDFVIANGVIAYDKVELPFGDFTFVTRGTVDLVNRTMDVVTFVPILALADEVVRISRFAPGVAMIPIRTRGPFGQTKSDVALELILDQGLPGAAIDGVGGIISGIGSAIEQALRQKEEEDKAKKEKKKLQQQQKKDREAAGGS